MCSIISARSFLRVGSPPVKVRVLTPNSAILSFESVEEQILKNETLLEKESDQEMRELLQGEKEETKTEVPIATPDH